MKHVYVSVGSNINREHYIRAAVKALRETFGELTISPIYESEAVGFKGENFLNLVIGFNTDLAVESLIAALDAIEDAHHRDRSGPRFSARTLDIDLLLYDGLVISSENLTLPRPEITKNAFVLKPLSDLAPLLIDPHSGRTYATLWQQFDQHSQSLWEIRFDF